MQVFHYLLIAVVGLLMSACQSGTEPAPPVANEGGLTDTISLDSAIAWTCRWQATTANGIPASWWNNNGFDAFTIPKADIEELAKETEADNYRAYVGLTWQNGSPITKLVMVGVDTSGDDILSLITDFTTPCPPTCQTSSPLYDCN